MEEKASPQAWKESNLKKFHEELKMFPKLVQVAGEMEESRKHRNPAYTNYVFEQDEKLKKTIRQQELNFWREIQFPLVNKYLKECQEKRQLLEAECLVPEESMDPAMENKKAQVYQSFCDEFQHAFDNLSDFMFLPAPEWIPPSPRLKSPVEVPGLEQNAWPIRIFSYNTFMWPTAAQLWGGWYGAQRFRSIIQQIQWHHMVEPLDVLCFCEMFNPLTTDKDSWQTEFDTQIGRVWPYSTYKINQKDRSLNGRYLVGGIKEKQLKMKSRLFQGIPYRMNSGLAIWSRFPIVKSDALIYKDCADEDCLSYKGALYVCVDKSQVGGKRCHLFLTHPQSGDRIEIQQMKLRQFRELEEFIRQQRIPTTEPVLLCGDLNIDYYRQKDALNKFLTRFNADIPPILNPVEDWKDCLAYRVWNEYIVPVLETKELQEMDPSIFRLFSHVWKKHKDYEKKKIPNAPASVYKAWFLENQEELRSLAQQEVPVQIPWTVCKTNDIENPNGILLRLQHMRTEWLDYVLYLRDYLQPVAASLKVLTKWFFGQRPSIPIARWTGMVNEKFFDSKDDKDRKNHLKQLHDLYDKKKILKSGEFFFNDLSDHFPIVATFWFPQVSPQRSSCHPSEMPLYRRGLDFSLDPKYVGV